MSGLRPGYPQDVLTPGDNPGQLSARLSTKHLRDFLAPLLDIPIDPLIAEVVLEYCRALINHHVSLMGLWEL